MIFAITSLEVYANENKAIWLVHFDDKQKNWEKVQIEKKRASRSKGLSLEHAIKFATVLDDKEFSEIEPSKSESNSDESNSDYLDVSEETLGGNVKSSLEVDTI